MSFDSCTFRNNLYQKIRALFICIMWLHIFSTYCFFSYCYWSTCYGHSNSITVTLVWVLIVFNVLSNLAVPRWWVFSSRNHTGPFLFGPPFTTAITLSEDYWCVLKGLGVGNILNYVGYPWEMYEDAHWKVQDGENQWFNLIDVVCMVQFRIRLDNSAVYGVRRAWRSQLASYCHLLVLSIYDVLTFRTIDLRRVDCIPPGTHWDCRRPQSHVLVGGRIFV